jgi:hypothetical protein
MTPSAVENDCWGARRKSRRRSCRPIPKLVTEDHYGGFPTVLLRLDKIVEKEQRALLTAAGPASAGESDDRKTAFHVPRS